MLEMEKKVEEMCSDHKQGSSKEWSWEMMPDTLERVGDLLRERIEQEEAMLYPLYDALATAGPIQQKDLFPALKAKPKPL